MNLDWLKSKPDSYHIVHSSYDLVLYEELVRTISGIKSALDRGIALCGTNFAPNNKQFAYQDKGEYLKYKELHPHGEISKYKNMRGGVLQCTGPIILSHQWDTVLNQSLQFERFAYPGTDLKLIRALFFL